MAVLLKMVFLELLIVITHFIYSSMSLQMWTPARGRSTTKSDSTFYVAALLSSQENLNLFRSELTKRNGTKVGTKTVYFEAITAIVEGNPLQAGYQLCDDVISTTRRLMAVIVSHPPGASDIPPLTASFTCSFYDIPLIGISARESSFSDKYSHSSFLRTVPPYSKEADGWAQMIQKFGWSELVFIHTNDVEGRILLSQLENLSNNKFKISRAVPLSDEFGNFSEILADVANEQIRAVLLYARRSEANDVLNAAKALGMFSAEWGWIISEQTLLGASRPLPQGVLSLNLSRDDEGPHVRDAVTVVVDGILAVVKQQCSSPTADCDAFEVESPSSCSQSADSPSPSFGVRKRSVRSIDMRRSPQRGRGRPMRKSKPDWRTFAQLLFKSFVGVAIPNGYTGKVEFNEDGDRQNPIFNIVNTDYMGRDTVVGTYGLKMVEPLDRDRRDLFFPYLNISMSSIKWPGNKTYFRKRPGHCEPSAKVCAENLVPGAPFSFKRKTTLRVVTKISIPFVYKRERPPKGCKTVLDPDVLEGEVECTELDPNTGFMKKYCCFGYCIDLLRRLANQTGYTKTGATPFNYSLYIVPDVGIERKVDNDTTTKWTGIMGEILKNDGADLAVAPVTITPERALRVAFTKPFKYLGLTILVKRDPTKNSLDSFLQPFEKTLWVLVFLSVHVVALVLYLLDRFSPFGRFKLTRSQQDSSDEALNLSSAMWFAWGVLLNSGIGEGTPRSFSARVLGMVWAGFAMIIVASYTANLAAFLVLDRPEAHISGIDDARLRNPQKNFAFATVKNSPVEDYFKRQLEFATMTRTMDKYKKDSAEEAIEAVKSGELKAFIWDSARLNYEAAKECDLITAGDVFGRTGYGLVMPKDSPWINEISQAVLNFHERGFMENLDIQWILVKQDHCKKTNASPATLGLKNMAGVFIMVAVGIVAGVFLIFIEIAYKRRRGLKEKELELAKTAADRWRSNIEKRKIMRSSLEKDHFDVDLPLGKVQHRSRAADNSNTHAATSANFTKSIV